MINLKNGQSEVRTGGRPTKYAPEVIDQLCSALSDGLSIKSACVVARIGVTTLSDWRDEHPELEERMSEAREFARQKALQSIKAAGKKDWRANAEWLRLTFPADYRGNAKVEVSATAHASSGVIITPERLAELQQWRREVLGGNE